MSGDYGVQTQALRSMGECEVGPSIERPTVTMELLRKKERLESELGKVNEVLAVMKKHPDAQEVLDAVSSIQGII